MSSLFIKDDSQNDFKLTLFLPEKQHPVPSKGQFFIASNVFLEKRDGKHEGRNGLFFLHFFFYFLYKIDFFLK